MKEAAKLISSSSLWLETGGQGQDTLILEMWRMWVRFSKLQLKQVAFPLHTTVTDFQWDALENATEELICIFKNLHVFQYLVHGDQKEPVCSLTAVTTSLL